MYGLYKNKRWLFIRSASNQALSIRFYGFHSIGQIIHSLYCIKKESEAAQALAIYNQTEWFAQHRKAKRNKFLLKIECFLICSDC